MNLFSHLVVTTKQTLHRSWSTLHTIQIKYYKLFQFWISNQDLIFFRSLYYFQPHEMFPSLTSTLRVYRNNSIRYQFKSYFFLNLLPRWGNCMICSWNLSPGRNPFYKWHRYRRRSPYPCTPNTDWLFEVQSHTWFVLNKSFAKLSHFLLV